MMTRFRLPVRALTAAVGGQHSHLIIDAGGVAVGGFFGNEHESLCEDAVAAINANAELVALLRQTRREYATRGHLSGETLVQIDSALGQVAS